MNCPACGAEASGNYCANCGASLRELTCPACRAKLPANARFCTNCGTALRGRSRNLPLYIAAGAVAVLVIILVLPMLRGPQIANGNGTAFNTPGSTGAPPPLTGTPREQADRLFNLIMEARWAGDSARMRRFVPMALMAYEQAAPLDDDGLYHLALIQIAGQQLADARATAQRILDRNPNHLLALSVAADAAAAAGDSAAARQYYTRIVEAYPTESARDLPEYRDHSKILPDIRARAEENR